MSRGYFSSGSVAARALSQRAVGLTYGQRALVIGATHPLLFLGTAAHTSHRETPWTRLALTARLFETVFLGTREEADRALSFTAKRHAPVIGTTSEDGGPAHPIGSAYSAATPELMWWTVAYTLDSVALMHDALVRPLSASEREDLLADFIRWGTLFGMPAEAAPSNWAAFREQFDARLHSDAAFLTDEARLVGEHLAGRHGYPLPGPGILAQGALATVVTGSLPDRVRQLYGFAWTRRDQAAYDRIATASRIFHQRVPVLPRLRPLYGPSAGHYRAVAGTEQRWIRAGRVSMPGVSDVPAPGTAASGL